MPTHSRGTKKLVRSLAPLRGRSYRQHRMCRAWHINTVCACGGDRITALLLHFLFLFELFPPLSMFRMTTALGQSSLRRFFADRSAAWGSRIALVRSRPISFRCGEPWNGRMARNDSRLRATWEVCKLREQSVLCVYVRGCDADGERVLADFALHFLPRAASPIHSHFFDSLCILRASVLECVLLCLPPNTFPFPFWTRIVRKTETAALGL